MQEAAPVGANECTSIVKAYPHPSNSHVVFWDVPGNGTKHVTASSYIGELLLEAFDIFLVVVSDRLRSFDVDLLENIGKVVNHSNIILIRSKMDKAIEDEANFLELPVEKAAEITYRNMKMSMERPLFECNLQAAQVFLISSRVR